MDKYLIGHTRRENMDKIIEFNETFNIVVGLAELVPCWEY